MMGKEGHFFRFKQIELCVSIFKFTPLNKQYVSMYITTLSVKTSFNNT